MSSHSEKRAKKDRRKPGSPATGWRRKGLRRLQDQEQILVEKLAKLRKDIEKLAGATAPRKRGRGWGSAKPEAGRKSFKRDPVIKSGLKELPITSRRFMSMAEKVRQITGRRTRRGLR